MKQFLLASLAAALVALSGYAGEPPPDHRPEPGLVGYWKLRGDCRDYSGQSNHGVNHGANLDSGTFDGIGAYVEVPNSASLKLGAGDFSLCAWIYTGNELDDVVGDVLDMYDPARRRGITLSINSTGSGYQGQGNDRHVCFGIDDARTSDWEDCGRPSPTSRYISNSMVVYHPDTLPHRAGDVSLFRRPAGLGPGCARAASRG